MDCSAGGVPASSGNPGLARVTGTSPILPAPVGHSSHRRTALLWNSGLVVYFARYATLPCVSDTPEVLPQVWQIKVIRRIGSHRAYTPWYWIDDLVHPTRRVVTGSIFISRLPEFAVGVWLGVVLSEQGESRLAHLRRPSWTLALMANWAASNFLGLTRLGMTFFPIATGVTGFALLSIVVTSRWGEWLIRRFEPAVSWIGQHSLSLFLVHHPIAFVLLRGQYGAESFPGVLLRFVAVIVISVIAAILLEKTTDLFVSGLTALNNRCGWRRVIRTAVASLVAIELFIHPFELSLRRTAPQDVPDFGWSERPALQPDDQLGFRLRTSSRTRLRWESYDYEVIGNSEGFPGPDLNGERPQVRFAS